MDVAAEVRVAFGVVDLDPAAAAARPRDVFVHPFHRDAGHVADDVGERHDLRRVERQVVVDFVEDQEAFVFARDADDGLQVLARLDDAEGVVRIDHQDADDVIVLADLRLEVVDVDAAAVVELERVGDVVAAVMHRLGRGMRGVRRVRADDAGRRGQVRKDLVDGLSEPVEEDDVFDGADARVAVVLQDEPARLEVALGRGVGIGAVLADGSLDDRLHPRREGLALGHRIADVLPDHRHSASNDFVRDFHDFADLVAEVLVTLLDQVLAHDVGRHRSGPPPPIQTASPMAPGGLPRNTRSRRTFPGSAIECSSGSSRVRVRGRLGSWSRWPG